ncbi:MAG: SdpI/YfhL protein family [Cytophagaceae bacterium]|jgi:uncharacterized membrane protein|nr:SdpI/YfhL protein family [Cytophagaceae bacterium]
MNNIDIYLGLGITIFMYLVQLGVYWYVTRFPPGEINSMYGYRTRRSMKNQVNWRFANALSNRLMLIVSHIYLLIALLLLLIFHNILSGQCYIAISTCLFLIAMALVIIITEYKLKQFEKKQV